MRVSALVPFAAVVVVSACTRRDTPAADSPSGPGLVAVAGPKQAARADAGAPGPRFVGRWVAEDGGMRCGWSGCYVTARFRGTGLGLRIEDDGTNFFQIVVDGAPTRVLQTDKAKGAALYPLVDGLPDGEHEVAIHRRTEAKVGEVVVRGFEPAGALLPPPPAPSRRIETIGDSISAGYGNEGPGPRCTYVPRQQNEYLTYGAIAARDLGADHTTIAWSGKTLHQMKVLFDQALPERDDGPRWDPSRYQPDVVLINLGTNNFALRDPGEAKFVRLYHELVHVVREAYPKALIVCALGSMLTDRYPEGRHHLTKARAYTKTAVAKLKEAGDANVAFLEFAEQDHADGLGCGFHPNLKTHERMAARLTAFLKERMRW